MDPKSSIPRKFITEELETIVKNAIDSFNRCERILIETDVSERCICAKFATYLEKELLKDKNKRYSEYSVDVEYNRGGRKVATDPKKLTKINEKEPHNIVVDLIVHRRTQCDNLICIEMKKDYVKADYTSDKERLQTLIQCPYKYKIGFFILIHRDKQANDCELQINASYS